MRAYYKDEWHCDCKPEDHTLEKYIKALHNIFDPEYEQAHITHDEKFIHVDTKDNVILALKIFDAEYHGLILSSIHSRQREEPFNSEISLLFKYPKSAIQKEKKNV